MVISSRSPPSLHLDQFLPAGGKTFHFFTNPVRFIFQDRVHHHVSGCCHPGHVSTTPFSAPRTGVSGAPNSTAGQSEVASPPPGPASNRAHGSGPEWVSISKHVASIPGSFNRNTAVFRVGIGGGGEGTKSLAADPNPVLPKLLPETLRPTIPRLVGPR